MAEVVGRAGFHATHAKSAGERVPALDEMMRSLDPERSAYWASRNPSIVLADESLNVELVNDGTGQMVPCTDPQQVLDYGQSRLDRLHRKLAPDHRDKFGKMVGGTVTTSLLVAHLPKSMCEEVPNYYPRFRKDGSPMLDPETGEQMFRSRWVARDRDEALRYFAHVREYLCNEVVPGGAEALLGESDQFSESTPHAQFLFDTFADHPNKAGLLRAEASRAWFSHREVKNDEGKAKSGPAKLRDYHAGLKEFLIAKGYEISPDFDAERHLTGFAKDEFGQVEDARAEAVAEREYTEGKLAAKLAVATKDGRELNDLRLAAKAELAAAEQDRMAAAADREEAHEIKRRARADGQREGYDDGLRRAEAEAAELMRLADHDRAEAARHEEATRVARRSLEAREERLAGLEERLATELERLENEPADFKEFLDMPLKDGRTMRPMYNKLMAPVRAKRARSQAILDGARQEVSRDAGHSLGG